MAIKTEYIFAGIIILSIVLLFRHHYHLYVDPSYLTTTQIAIINDSQRSNKVYEKDNILKNYNLKSRQFNLISNITSLSLHDIETLITESNAKDNVIQKLQQQLQEAQTVIRNGNNNRLNSNSFDVNKDLIKPSYSNEKSYSQPIQSHGTTYILNVSNTILTQSCEERFGIQLIDKWRKTEEVWCSSSSSSISSSSSSSSSSELKCYPYHQEHKKLDGRGKDMFCVATNFLMDFSLVHGDSSAKGGKPPLGDQYHEFDKGSLRANCHKTEKYKESLFMPHHKQQMQSFQADSPLPAAADTYFIEERPTYLLARDEDCENTFHTTADMMNMYLVLNVLNLSPLDSHLQVILFDKHGDDPYKDFIGQVYAPYRNKDTSSSSSSSSLLSHSVLRSSHYKNKLVLFRQLIFHLESPAGLIFPKVTRPDPVRCFSTSFFQAYRRFVLHSLSLWDTATTTGSVSTTSSSGSGSSMTTPLILVPTVTLTLRHRSPHKNVGRVMANEAEVVSMLQTGTMINLEVVDFSAMPFLEQLKLIRRTNVLVGVHGAGLMLIMFAAEEAVLVEIHPSYRQDRHFRHAARMTGKHYMSLRARLRETCQGSSDNIMVPLDEFRSAMDGAVRLARTFDGGLVECGLVCAPEILAMDPRLDGQYTAHHMVKGRSIDTSFPC